MKTETKIESLKWTTEAGPRQTKDVQKAISYLLNAGGGTLYKRTSPVTGEHCETIMHVMLGSRSEAENAQKDRCVSALNTLNKKYGGTITRTNCRDIISDCQKHFHTLEAFRPVVDERKTQEQVQTEKQERNEAAAVREAEATEAAKVRAVEVTDCQKAFPYLLTADRHSGGVSVAKNIRIILKREFPSIKFSVKSDYSSVNIGWDDGPTKEAVGSHVNKFNSGNFNGMDDSYDFDITAFNDAFGSVKYIFCNRGFRDGLREAVQEAVEADMGGSMEHWEKEQHAQRRAHKALGATDLTGKGDFTGAAMDYDLQRYILSFQTVELPKPTGPTPTGTTSGTGYAIKEHTHSKKGFKMWIVVLADKVDRDTFNELRERAKTGGGWYSREWNDVPGGFAFKEREAAELFAGTLGGKPSPDRAPPEGQRSKEEIDSHERDYFPRPKPVKRPYKAMRLTADRLTGQIEAKRQPMTKNPTPKRSLQHKHNLIEADRLERVQRALLEIADRVEVGTYSGKVPSKADLLEYLRHRVDCSGGYYSAYDTGEYSNKAPEAVLIQEMLETAQTPDQEREQADRKAEQTIKGKILDLAGVKIPGFFVTPQKVAERVIYEADIRKWETVLEPSAGTGNLADLARKAGGIITCVEIRPALVEILELKGYRTANEDFIKWAACDQYDEETGQTSRPAFDKIVLNPPFEKGQDIEHVRAAYACLKEGGRLVAIMGEGAFFHSDSQAGCFRDWLYEIGGSSEKLPEGSFKGTGEITSTGTATRLVIIDK